MTVGLRSVLDGIVRAAEADPLAPAIADLGRRWDRRTVVGAAGGVAESIESHAGGVVAVLADDARDLAVAALAAMAVGAALVPLDPRQGEERLVRTCRALGVRAVLHGARAVPPREFSALPLSGVEPGPLRPRTVAGDAIGLLMTSSGSSGEPKTIPRTRDDLTAILHSPTERHLRPGDRLGTLLGATGATVRRILGALSAGVEVTMLDARGVEPERILSAFASAEVTVLSLIPTYLRRLTGAARPGIALPRLRLVTTVGEPLLWSDVAAVRARLNPRATVQNRYGSTDAASISSRDVPPDEALGDGAVPVGRAHPGVTIHILDADLAPVPDGAVGEVVVDSPRRRENPTRIDLPDGRYRYRTGDAGRLLPDGQLELLGRIDRLVKIGGIRVEPARVESTLRELPWVGEAFVDVERTEDGQALLTAHLVVRTGRDLAEPPAGSFLRARLHVAEVPGRILIHAGPLPTLQTGKVDGLELRRRAAGSAARELTLD